MRTRRSLKGEPNNRVVLIAPKGHRILIYGLKKFVIFRVPLHGQTKTRLEDLRSLKAGHVVPTEVTNFSEVASNHQAIFNSEDV